jgi:hypothetical protein
MGILPAEGAKADEIGLLMAGVREGDAAHPESEPA